MSGSYVKSRQELHIYKVVTIYYTKRNIRYYYKKRIKIKRHEPKIIS